MKQITIVGLSLGLLFMVGALLLSVTPPAVNANVAGVQITPTASVTPTPDPGNLYVDLLPNTPHIMSDVVCGPLGTQISIFNAGNAHAGSFVVAVNGLPYVIDVIWAKQSVSFWIPSYVVGATRVEVDTTNLINESDETNNIFDAPLPIPTPVPCTPSATPTITPTPTVTPTPSYGDPCQTPSPTPLLAPALGSASITATVTPTPCPSATPSITPTTEATPHHSDLFLPIAANH